jgi:collagen type III alpha
MILSRFRSDVRQQMRIVEAWTTGRAPQFNVVGESRYYQQIRKVAGRLGGGPSGEAITTAVLRPEPENAYDRNAVQVTIDDLVVGYLPAEEAPNYSPLLIHLAGQGVLVSVPARVWWDAEGDFMASVRLDLAPPGLLIPVNAPPAGNVMQLPPGNAIQVVGEDAHLDVLAPIVAGYGQAAALVTLHEISEQKTRTVKQIVEVRIDGPRVGQLTPAMSEHLLAVIRLATTAGVTLYCRASIRGNQIKAEVTIYPTKAADLPSAWIAELEARPGARQETKHEPAIAARAAVEDVQPAPTALPPADWYPNPTGPGLRWWNGQQWTDHTHVQ